jgi:hypothetical protein
MCLFCRLMYITNDLIEECWSKQGKPFPNKWATISIHTYRDYLFKAYFFLVVKGPAADATDAPQPWGCLCNHMMKMMMMMMIIIFYPFPSNGKLVEWNWQGKTEVLGEKPVPVPLCPPQIPKGRTRDRTRAFAVGGRRLTASAMARPSLLVTWYVSRFINQILYIQSTLYFVYFIYLRTNTDLLPI